MPIRLEKWTFIGTLQSARGSCKAATCFRLLAPSTQAHPQLLVRIAVSSEIAIRPSLTSNNPEAQAESSYPAAEPDKLDLLSRATADLRPLIGGAIATTRARDRMTPPMPPILLPLF